jgi:uncharacterized metal-binding protein YceD (DUF177 family)
MTILPWTHAIADMPSSSRAYTRDATPAECAAIAADLGLLSCSKLHADYTIRALGGGRYKLTGNVSTSITQSCVVTLEPIASDVTLPIDVEFSPEANAPPPSKADEEEAEILSLPDLEPIENASLDAGRVVYETLAAGIEPFPKKPGAEFAWDDPRAKDSKANPFAVLATLKPKQ